MLPGFNNVAGLWPAIWTMGNLGELVVSNPTVPHVLMTIVTSLCNE